MDAQHRRRAAPELIELLERIWRDERSYRRMSERAGLSPDTLAKIAGGRGGMSSETARKLTTTFGERYCFSEDQVLAWAGHKSASADDPFARLARFEEQGILQSVRMGLSRAEQRLTPRKLRTIATILADQIEMLTRMSEEGRLPETDYRAGEEDGQG